MIVVIPFAYDRGLIYDILKAAKIVPDKIFLKKINYF